MVKKRYIVSAFHIKNPPLNSMDSQSSGILGLVAIIVSVGGSILAVINHSRVRSSCCGRVGEISLDITQTTPPVKLNRILTVPQAVIEPQSESHHDLTSPV